MRSVSTKWGALNAALSKESRRLFVRIEPNPGTAADDYYLLSHGDITITSAGTVLSSRIVDCRIGTQELNPDEGRSTIGGGVVTALDVGSSLTDQQRADLLTDENGLRGKRVQIYSGFAELDDTDYELEDTQIVELVEWVNRSWVIRCRDVQRSMRKTIMEPVVLHLAQPLDDSSTTIEVYTTTGLEAVEHGTSYSDAPSSTVAYVQIDDEIIRVPSGGIGATQLTSCVRGVLGTRAAEHSTDETKGSERGTKVTEVIYLEMPVPKLAWALLTGDLLEQTPNLPDHWNLGITSTFARKSDFEDIGADLYVTSDDTKGTKERYILTKGFDGKAFIERQLMRKYGLFMPVHQDGQIGLRRGQSVLSGSATVGEINDSHLLHPPNFKWDMTKILNHLEIQWNEVRGEPSRFLKIRDTVSIDRWGESAKHVILCKGLSGASHTEDVVRDIFEGFRDRYSGPPIEVDVDVRGSQNLYEVGDVVRLKTERARDFTNDATASMDRAFEVQRINKDLIRNRVTYSLFGSSQKAGPLPPLESGNALNDSFYTSAGTDIAGLSGVVDTGSELELPNGLNLSGHADITNASAIYYATKDVRIPSGNTVNYDDNVQLRIRGDFFPDGTLSGKGGGHAGVADTVSTAAIPTYWAVEGPVNFSTDGGVSGYFGHTQADGGLIERVDSFGPGEQWYRGRLQSFPADITYGQVDAIPSYNLLSDGDSIEGLPTDLRGTSGGGGGVRYWSNFDFLTQVNRGGTGGAGGAGLLIVCRGMAFGASGKIDSSGDDGAAGSYDAGDTQPAYAGAGAGGAPGAVIILLDGDTVLAPTLTNGTIVAEYGDSPNPSSFNHYPTPWLENTSVQFGDGKQMPDDCYCHPDHLSASSGRQAGIAAARYFFLLPDTDAEEDTQDIALANAQDISLAVTEEFDEIVDHKITQLRATITENTVTDAYSHANIYSQRTTGANPQPVPHFQGEADGYLQFQLPADGETYTIIARAVLNNGVEADTDVVQTQVVSTPGSAVGYVKHVYKNAASAPSSPTSMDPTPSGWTTAPSTPPAGQFTWVSQATISWDTTTVLVDWSTPSKFSGDDGSDGSDGDDGFIGGLPPEIAAAGVMTCRMVKNRTSAGANPGEIEFFNGNFTVEGSVRFSVQAGSGSTEHGTPYETATGHTPRDDYFYLVSGATTCTTRFPGWANSGTLNNQGLFCAEYDKAAEQWYAIEDDGTEHAFTPAADDYIVARGYMASGDTEITQLSPTVPSGSYRCFIEDGNTVVWQTDDSVWEPSPASGDNVIEKEFVVELDGVEVARSTIEFELDDTGGANDGDIAVTETANTGDSNTLSVVNNNEPNPVATITHDPSGCFEIIRALAIPAPGYTGPTKA